MFLSEHQSKELLAQYDMPVPAGRLARTVQEAEQRCAEISARKYVVKAQIMAGGRGLAGCRCACGGREREMDVEVRPPCISPTVGHPKKRAFSPAPENFPPRAPW